MVVTLVVALAARMPHLSFIGCASPALRRGERRFPTLRLRPEWCLWLTTVDHMRAFLTSCSYFYKNAELPHPHVLEDCVFFLSERPSALVTPGRSLGDLVGVFGASGGFAAV